MGRPWLSKTDYEKRDRIGAVAIFVCGGILLAIVAIIWAMSSDQRFF